MHRLRNSIVTLPLLTVLAIPVALNTVTVATPIQDSEKTPQNVLVLVDRSGSTGLQPHYQEAVVNQLFELSRLTRGRVKLAFIFFGAEVEVIAGADGLPAAAGEPIREGCRNQLAKPCAGGTPLSTALEHLNEMLAAIPSGELKSVVLLSDGDANLPISPSLFPSVKTELDRLYAKANQERSQDPDSIEKLEVRLGDPNSDIVRGLFEMQRPLVQDLCKQLASNTNALGIRFVSIAFNKDLQGLKDIHKAAGGSDADYIECGQESALDALHKAQIVSGLLSFNTLELPASEKFSFTEDIPIAGSIGAETLLTVQFAATSQITQLARIGIQVDGTQHLVGEGASELSIANDSEGRLATISLVCPPTKHARLGFSAINNQIAFPGAKIYRLIELPDNLKFVCKPSDSEQEPPPYEIPEQRNCDFLVGLQFDDKQAIGLQGGEVVLKHAETGRQHLVKLRRDRQFTDLLVAPRVKQLTKGTYSIEAHLQLASGLSLSTSLERHFKIVGVEERVRIDIGQESESIDRIDFGKLGNAKREKTVSIKIASDTPFDLPLKLRITNLKDANGTAVGSDWIKTDGDTDSHILPSGSEIELKIRCEIPKTVADAIVDGQVSGRFELVNADTLQPIKLLPAIVDVATPESLKQVQLALARPQLRLSARRAWRDWIGIGDGDRQVLFANANIAFPYTRSIKLKLSTDSHEDRNLQIRIGRCRDSSGVSVDGVELSLPEKEAAGSVRIPAGGSTTIDLPFNVQKANTRGFGEIVIGGDGIATEVIRFDVGSTAMNGKWISWVATAIFISLSLVWFKQLLTKNKLASFARTTSPNGRRFRCGDVLNAVRIEPLGTDQVKFIPIVEDQLVQIGNEEARPFDREITEQSTSPVAIFGPDDSQFEITGFSMDLQDCWIRVLCGGDSERAFRKAQRLGLWLTFLASIALVVAIGVNHWPIVTEIVQFTVDLIRLNTYSPFLSV